jgi:thiol-disulfide isomerase/thioredoxin
MSPTETGTFRVIMDGVAVGQTIAAEVFAFDTQGKTAVDSFGKLIQAGNLADDGGVHPLQDQPAPPLDLLTVDGQPFKLADAAKAHTILVLDFWATWCPPCREGLPKLHAVADWVKQNRKPVGIFTVNLQETPQEVQAFWKKQGFTLPVLMDPQGQAAAAYHVSSIPQTVILKDGVVRHVIVGLEPNAEESLKTMIDELLAEPTAGPATQTAPPPAKITP